MTVRVARDLRSALAVGAGDLVSLVGGGGKTTTLYRLTDDLTRGGLKAAAATTTKIAAPGPEDRALLLCEPQWDDLVRRLEGWNWAGGHPPVLGAGLLSATKVEGIPPQWCDRLVGERVVDVLVVEADGAARKAVKAPESWEPVVPAATTLFVAVVGLSCVGLPLCADVAFRPDKIAAVTGCAPGAPLTPAVLASLLSTPEGLLKGRTDAMRATALLNQADLPGAWEQGRLLASLLCETTDAYHRVLVACLQRDDAEIEIWEPADHP